jgi:hypothetical protein
MSNKITSNDEIKKLIKKKTKKKNLRLKIWDHVNLIEKKYIKKHKFQGSITNVEKLN